MKTAKDLKEQFRRLEVAGNDDFELILLGGPDAYATHELSQLLRQLKIRRVKSVEQQRQLFRLAVAPPVLLILAVAFIGIGRIEIVYFCLVISAICTAALVWKSYQLRNLIREVNNRDQLLRGVISRELARRREMA